MRYFFEELSEAFRQFLKILAFESYDCSGKRDVALSHLTWAQILTILSNLILIITLL